ncbi:Prolyl endopeptidase [Pseudolycoriella hygida]|uniref:Prolyl endopeptidase n=1 Tax=Pseudolycoriella hygida TaxID=35572 RepID=A0A9Q0NB59_9DIPT|nr:Prolyl endopeptidase [Pseudolycoriella hygida]
MIVSHRVAVAITVVVVLASLVSGLTYPNVARNTTVEDKYGTVVVPDPYRWLESPDTNATKSFVTEQNGLSTPYFEQCPFRAEIRDRLAKVWNYRKVNPPQKHGNHYFQYANNGLQDQNVLYIQDALEGDNTNRRVFLDPNLLSTDGTVALTSTQSFSKDGSLFAYGISTSGSDWRKVYIRNVSSNENLEDVLIKVKFTDLVWKGNEGIFYGHYPDFEGDPEGSDTGTNENQKISFHRIGTRQEDDVIVVEFPEKPKNLIASMDITSNDQYLIVRPSAGSDEGSYGDNTIYYVDLSDSNPVNWQRRPIVETYNAGYSFITDYGNMLYFLTNFNAPRYKIVGIQISSPAPETWTTIIEEDSENVLNWAAPINRDYILLDYLENVASKLVVRSLIVGNSFSKQIPIEKGTVTSYAGKIEDTQLFIKFESFLVPNRIYQLDFTTPVDQIELEVFDDVEIEGLDFTLFEVKQVKYNSKDGTEVPMYIMHKKNLTLNATSPAMLYGYGGFNINILPEFSVRRIVFMQSFDGVAAVANIRGGGEFGNSWHEGGSLLNKQNVFDDFQAAAEYLIAQNYTNAQKMIIEGRSNGGLLVGACVNQRPDLYGAAIASVGVMDMLRFHLFTIGHSWVSEYGSSANSAQFPYIYAYSPLHNIKFPQSAGVQYPAVLVTTSDHDDRVVPSHSYKYTAELQHTIGGNENQSQPLLLRVETDAGHGAGSPISKLIDEQVDILSFLTESLDLAFEGQRKAPTDSGATSVLYSVGSMLVTITFAFWVSHSFTL